jgi:hypothetical protein
VVSFAHVSSGQKLGYIYKFGSNSRKKIKNVKNQLNAIVLKKITYFEKIS